LSPPRKRGSETAPKRRARSPRPKVPDEKLAPAKELEPNKPALKRARAPARDVRLVLAGARRWDRSFNVSGDTPPQMELRLAEVRDRLRVTQARFGALVHAHPITVCKWEKGHAEPDAWQLTVLRILARASLAPPPFSWHRPYLCTSDDERRAWDAEEVPRRLVELLAAGLGGRFEGPRDRAD